MHPFSFFARRGGVLVAALTAASLTRAAFIYIPTTPPPATWSGSLSGSENGASYSNLNLAAPGLFSFGAGGAGGSIDGLGGFSASLSANVNLTSTGGDAFASAYDSFTYAFEIFGPTPTVNLQVDATGSASTSLAPNSAFTSGNSAGADFQIYPAGQAFTLVGVAATGYGLGTTSAGFSTALGVYGDDENGYNSEVNDGEFAAETNTVYFVDMTAGAEVSITDGVGSLSASAYVDPIIQLAADVPDPQDFSFTYSPGISAGVPVADPASTLGLLGLAAAGLVGFARRRVLAAR